VIAAVVAVLGKEIYNNLCRIALNLAVQKWNGLASPRLETPVTVEKDYFRANLYASNVHNPALIYPTECLQRETFIVEYTGGARLCIYPPAGT
jgi:hypothetical protein